MLDHHGIFTQFFLDPEVIFSSHTMFINAPTKDTFSDLAFHVHTSKFVYRWNVCILYEWTDSKMLYKVAKCHYTELCHVIA